MGFFKDLFGAREPCAICQLGQASWPSSNSGVADWKLQGHGLNTSLLICRRCRAGIMEAGVGTANPMTVMGLAVKAGWTPRPPLHAYHQHPGWRAVWLHILDASATRPADEFAALAAMAPLEKEFMRSAGVTTQGSEGTPGHGTVPVTASEFGAVMAAAAFDLAFQGPSSLLHALQESSVGGHPLESCGAPHCGCIPPLPADRRAEPTRATELCDAFSMELAEALLAVPDVPELADADVDSVAKGMQERFANYSLMVPESSAQLAAPTFGRMASEAVKSRIVCKSERKLLDASVRLPWRPPSVREA